MAFRDFDEELKEFLGKPVDVIGLINDMDFPEEEVESAAIANPTLYLTAARLYVQKMRNRVRTKMAWEAESARTRIHIGGTVQYKKDKSLLVKSVRVAERAYEAALREEAFAKAVMEACRLRRDATRIIMDGRWAEAGSVMRRAKEKEGRELMKKAQKDLRSRYRDTAEEDDD